MGLFRQGPCFKNRENRMPLAATFLTVFLVFAAAQVPAAEPAEEGKKKSSTDLELQLSSVPEIKLCLNQSFVFPFLQGSSPLTQDNNLTAALRAEVTPVSVNGIGEVTLSPAAFFLLSGGGRAGSGWNNFLGNGIGVNNPEDENAARPRKSTIEGSAFDGLLWAAWGAGTLQFDLGALVPGGWTHVLFQTRQEFRYAAYTQAEGGDSWVFEHDYAENKNGWIYYARYVLGYYMPQSPILDTIAFMAEQEKPLYNTPGGDFWGESLGKWTFSGLFNFTIHPRFSTAFVVQMRTFRNHGSSDFENEGYYYRDFELKTEGGQRRILFHRVALVCNYKIR
jgi:hypothetical protein